MERSLDFMLLNLHTGSLIHINHLSITYKKYNTVLKIDNLKAAASKFELQKEPRTQHIPAYVKIMASKHIFQI